MFSSLRMGGYFLLYIRFDALVLVRPLSIESVMLDVIIFMVGSCLVFLDTATLILSLRVRWPPIPPLLEMLSSTRRKAQLSTY